MPTPLFVSQKDTNTNRYDINQLGIPTRNGLAIVSRQIELWATKEQKQPFTSFQTGWTSTGAGWSIDGFGYVHFHGEFTFSGGAITGNQTVCSIGSVQAFPTNAIGVSGATAGQIVLGNPFFIQWGVSTAGVVSMNLGATSSGSFVVNISGVLYHPVLL